MGRRESEEGKGWLEVHIGTNIAETGTYALTHARISSLPVAYEKADTRTDTRTEAYLHLAISI